MLLRHTTSEVAERQALTVNPAKTCQPIGAMYAALGIHNCLPHSHGSQGCCSYHRSALTRHYKEPVMAGTSSFTEGASVFGGQANLLQAIVAGAVAPGELADDEFEEVLGTCLACKACSAECPAAVDMAALKAEWLAELNARDGVPLLARHGFEIVDKHSGKEVYLDGYWAELFQQHINAWQRNAPTQEEVEDLLASYAELAQNPIRVH